MISTNSNSPRNEVLIVYSTGIFITGIAGFFFHITGYPRVVTAIETLDIVSPPLYILPIFLLFGILLGELFWIWFEERRNKPWVLFFIECFTIAAVSFIRFLMRIPFSGHTIILFFYLPHHVFTNKFQYPYRILLGFLVLIITLFYKIFLWEDIITFILGLTIGISIWLPGFVYRSKYFVQRHQT